MPGEVVDALYVSLLGKVGWVLGGWVIFTRDPWGNEPIFTMKFYNIYFANGWFNHHPDLDVCFWSTFFFGRVL